MDLRAVRSGMRRGLLTSYRNTTLGFRVARTLASEKDIEKR